METRLEAVRRILNAAADQIFPGNPSHDGLGRFWNLPRDRFVNAVVYNQQVIVLGKPDDSALIKSLRGLPPFDGSKFSRMPLGRPPISDVDITFIANWIRDGCPETDPAVMMKMATAVHEDAEKELKLLEAKWAAAVETNDPTQIGRFFTGEFLFVGAGGVLQDRAQHLEDFRTGRLNVQSVALGASIIHVYDGVAVVSSTVDVKGKFGDRDISGPYQFTDTWIRHDGRWLSVARQQTRITIAPKADE
jgi:hypothetical protein